MEPCGGTGGAPGPLKGLRVLEFSHTIMGPCAGLLLADMGADVVIHTVGIGANDDRNLLQGLSADTGGYYVDVDKGLRDFERRRRALPETARSLLDRR